MNFRRLNAATSDDSSAKHFPYFRRLVFAEQNGSLPRAFSCCLPHRRQIMGSIVHGVTNSGKLRPQIDAAFGD